MLSVFHYNQQYKLGLYAATENAAKFSGTAGSESVTCPQTDRQSDVKIKLAPILCRHGSDADPNPTFDFDAYQDPYPTPNFTEVIKPEIELIFLHSSASSHCFIFLFGIILVGVTKTNILDSTLF